MGWDQAFALENIALCAEKQACKHLRWQTRRGPVCLTQLLFAKLFRHCWLMPNVPDWDRLAQFVRSARGARTQRAITEAGGPSNTTLGKIEANEWRPTRGVDDTLNKLDTAFNWEPGSAAKILGGGDPISRQRLGLGAGLASLIPTGQELQPGGDASGGIAFVPRLRPRPQGTREEWIRKGEHLAHSVPVIPFKADTQRREAAKKALARTFGKDAEPTTEMLRMMRDLLEERELDTLIDRIEKLSRPGQLEISGYVNELLDWEHSGNDSRLPEDVITPTDDLPIPGVRDSDLTVTDQHDGDRRDYGLAARIEDDPKEDDPE